MNHNDSFRAFAAWSEKFPSKYQFVQSGVSFKNVNYKSPLLEMWDTFGKSYIKNWCVNGLISGLAVGVYAPIISTPPKIVLCTTSVQISWIPDQVKVLNKENRIVEVQVKLDAKGIRRILENTEEKVQQMEKSYKGCLMGSVEWRQRRKVVKEVKEYEEKMEYEVLYNKQFTEEQYMEIKEVHKYMERKTIDKEKENKMMLYMSKMGYPVYKAGVELRFRGRMKWTSIPQERKYHVITNRELVEKMDYEGWYGKELSIEEYQQLKAVEEDMEKYGPYNDDYNKEIAHTRYVYPPGMKNQKISPSVRFWREFKASGFNRKAYKGVSFSAKLKERFPSLEFLGIGREKVNMKTLIVARKGLVGGSGKGGEFGERFARFAEDYDRERKKDKRRNGKKKKKRSRSIEICEGKGPFIPEPNIRVDRPNDKKKVEKNDKAKGKNPKYKKGHDDDSDDSESDEGDGNKKRLPKLNLDPLPIEIDPFEDWHEFEYSDTYWLLWCIPVRITRRMRLPHALREYIDSNYPWPRNSISKTQYDYTISVNPLYLAYHNHYRYTELEAYLQKSVERYWFAYEKQISQTKYDVALANSKFYSTRRKAISALGNEKDIYWPRWLVVTALVGTGVLAYLATRRVHNTINSALDVLPYRRVRMHSIIPEFQTVTVYLEEVIKTLPWGWKLIAFIEYLMNGDWGTWKWHKKSSNWSFKQRVNAHFKLNKSLAGGENVHDHEYKVFLRDYSRNNFTPGVFQLYCRVLPTAWRPWPGDQESINILEENRIEHCLSTDNQYVPSKETYWYPLALGLSTIVVPRNCYEMRWITAVGRVKKYRNSTVEDDLYNIIMNLSSTWYFDEIEIPNWEDNLDLRQRKNLEVARKNQQSQARFNHIKVQIKSDECLFATKKLVPRLLSNQSGEEFLRMGKQTAQISKWVHDVFLAGVDSAPIVMNMDIVRSVFLSTDFEDELDIIFQEDPQPVNYYCLFTAGATSSDLNRFVAGSIANNGVFIMVMGDDSHLSCNTLDHSYVLENDFSAYDRSQSERLRGIVDAILHRSGFEELCIARKEEYSKKLKFPREINGLPTPDITDSVGNRADMRYTGEAATCLDNSIINVLVTIVCHYLSNHNVNRLEQLYKRCGLGAKIKRFPNYEHSTFLKGVFLKDEEDQPCWVRLPSFLLKFGKVLTDPNLIVKTRGIEYSEKCAMILRGQWLSYGNMSHVGPYARLNEIVLDLTSGTRYCRIQLDFWQVVSSRSNYISDFTFGKFLYDRYALTIEEFYEIVNMLEHVDRDELPITWYHPSFNKLLVDY